MTRWVHARRTVSGAPDRLEDLLVREVDALLVAATSTPDEPRGADGSFALVLPSRPAGRDVRKRVRATIGVARRSGSRVLVPLRWHAEPGRHGFPSFVGTLELEAMDVDRGPRTRHELALIGCYRPRLGPVGAVGDAAGLHVVAEDTVTRLVDLLAEQLADPEHDVAAPRTPTSPLLDVRDVMTPDPIVFDVDLPLRTAARVLLHRAISGAPVVGDDGGLVGVLSERDLLDREAGPRYGLGREVRRAERRRTARTAGEACTRPARTTAPDVPLRDAAALMAEHDIARLVVVDGAVVAGVVTRHDVLRALVRGDDEIAAAVRGVLDTTGEPGVDATVALGDVALHGVARLRSAVPSLVGQVARVDGVAEVDAEALSWEVDDVGLPPLLHA